MTDPKYVTLFFAISCDFCAFFLTRNSPIIHMSNIENWVSFTFENDSRLQTIEENLFCSHEFELSVYLSIKTFLSKFT